MNRRSPRKTVHCLTVEYDGARFDGWQVQPGRRTVQGELEKALKVLFKTRVAVVAAGRTDAGVHATGQAATFLAPRGFPGDLAAALNRLLPEDVSLLSAVRCRKDVHARRDAVRKTYRYTILNRVARPALDRTRVHWVARPLNAAAMGRETRRWTGKRDFARFGTPPFPNGSVCNVSAFRVSRKGDRLYIEITANRFLKRMARRLAGHLAQIGWGRKTPIPLALPARGLTLLEVVY